MKLAHLFLSAVVLGASLTVATGTHTATAASATAVATATPKPAAVATPKPAAPAATTLNPLVKVLLQSMGLYGGAPS